MICVHQLIYELKWVDYALAPLLGSLSPLHQAPTPSTNRKHIPYSVVLYTLGNSEDALDRGYIRIWFESSRSWKLLIRQLRSHRSTIGLDQNQTKEELIMLFILRGLQKIARGLGWGVRRFCCLMISTSSAVTLLVTYYALRCNEAKKLYAGLLLTKQKV
jgi:hypothetical protein